MRRWLLLAALGLSGCNCISEPPHAASSVPTEQQAPDTQGIEGHGGIAVVEPKPAVPAPAAPVAALPAARTGACAESDPKERYLQGYQRQDTDKKGAADAFRYVVQCTPPEDELHKKAEARLVLLNAP